MTSLADALRAATAQIADAGSESARVEAELLAGHVLGLGPGALRAAALRGDPAPAGLDDLVRDRVAGVPVQHLTGRAAFRRLELIVGPGVFIPRPETELVAQAAVDECRRLADGVDRDVIAVDLCTGSGAIAAALAIELPPAVQLWAVEIDRTAAGVARRNLPARVHLEIADATCGHTLAALDGLVDVVVTNPPYVPDSAPVPGPVHREPRHAVFGGPSGYEVPFAVARRAITLLRPGGLLVLEHHDDGQDEFIERLTATGFREVTGHRDLAGRPRFVSARA